MMFSSFSIFCFGDPYKTPFPSVTGRGPHSNNDLFVSKNKGVSSRFKDKRDHFDLMCMTTRIITFLVGDPYKSAFAAVTGREPHQVYEYLRPSRVQLSREEC